MKNPNQNSLLAAALSYHALGWSIIALEPGTKHSPRRRPWKRFATQRPRKRELERWFRTADVNLGVVLGPVSRGLCVRDFDEEEAYLEWARNHADLAQQLPTSRTARGYHVFFLVDQRDSGLPTRLAYVSLPDGELRIRNCHVQLPPSTHPDGSHYRWLREPFHGLKIVYSVQAAGLLPTHTSATAKVESKVDSGGARARSSLPCHSKPSHSQERGAPPELFRSDPQAEIPINKGAFDELLGWTVPTKSGMRENCLWKLARTLKTLKETQYLPVDELKPLVRYWWQQSLSVISTKPWWETWAAFGRCWIRAKVPLGGTALQPVVERARRQGCPPEVAEEFGGDVSGLIVAICRELAVEARGGAFYLGSRALGEQCGIGQWGASACLRALRDSRVLKVVREAQQGKAREYLYLLPLPEFPEWKTAEENPRTSESSLVEAESGDRK